MRGQAIALVTFLTAATALAGCSTAGNEVMIFATDTKVAIDISADPTGQPNLTIGYKRREGVWLPLSARNIAAEPTHSCRGMPPTLQCGVIGPSDMGTHVCRSAEQDGNALIGAQKLSCQPIGEVRRQLYEGRGGTDSRDSYSVMASFGLKATTTGGAEIAQYFATGLAARELAHKGGAALVSTSALTPEAQVEAARLVERIKSDSTKITEYVYPSGTFDVSRLNKLADTSTIQDANKTRLKGLTGLSQSDFSSRLSREFTGQLPDLSKTVDKL